MPNADSDFKFAHWSRGLGCFAHVWVSVHEQTGPVGTTFAGDGSQSQGPTEAARTVGYEQWQAAAVAGAKFALRRMGIDRAVTISRVVGIHTDTTPTVVAIAAAYAVWKAEQYTPNDTLVASLKELARSSWDDPQTVAQTILEG